MRPPSSSRINRKEFLRKWLSTLQIYSTSSPENSNGSKNKQTATMSLLERKTAIKISADVAMASTRVATSLWGRALISNARRNHVTTHNQALLDHIVGPPNGYAAHDIDSHRTSNKMEVPKDPYAMKKRLAKRSMILMKKKKRMIDRKKVVAGIAARRTRAKKIAKRVVKKRTEVLRGLVPGGEKMEECCLIREAVDYILSLRAQVEVMQHLANATQICNSMYNGA